MPAIVKRLIGEAGKSDEDPSRNYPYSVTGAATFDDAYDAVLDEVTANPPTTALALAAILPESRGKGCWEVVASYKKFQLDAPKTVGESSFFFSIQVQPVRVYRGIVDATVYKRSSDLPPRGIWLIGDQGIADQQPEGVEIFEPTSDAGETHIISDTNMTQTYKNTLQDIVGTTNNSTFKGRAAGECLLVGVSGTKRGTSDWEVSFRWMVRKNRTNIVHDGITVTSKKGWQYIWFRYQLEQDSDANTVVSRHIRYAIVETVYYESDFSALGIGT